MSSSHGRGRSPRRGSRAVLAVLLAGMVSLATVACTKEMPEPQTPGARAYRARCSGCHVLFHPSLLTGEMWKMQVRLMEEGEFRRRGLELSGEERRLITEYLTTHAGVR